MWSFGSRRPRTSERAAAAAATAAACPLWVKIDTPPLWVKVDTPQGWRPVFPPVRVNFRPSQISLYQTIYSLFRERCNRAARRLAPTLAKLPRPVDWSLVCASMSCFSPSTRRCVRGACFSQICIYYLSRVKTSAGPTPSTDKPAVKTIFLDLVNYTGTLITNRRPRAVRHSQL